MKTFTGINVYRELEYFAPMLFLYDFIGKAQFDQSNFIRFFAIQKLAAFKYFYNKLDQGRHRYVSRNLFQLYLSQ
jgi:hypothetical protein